MCQERGTLSQTNATFEKNANFWSTTNEKSNISMLFVLYVVYAHFQKCMSIKKEASHQKKTQAEETPGSLTGDPVTFFWKGSTPLQVTC